jgi:hypothetical protein
MAVVCFSRRMFDVFDDVELDVAGGQDFQDAPRLASIGVVVDGHVGHEDLLSDIGCGLLWWV